MDAYTVLAELYDELMDNVDYPAWCDFIAEKLARRGITDGILLDLACGTGVLTELLAEKGYDMIGVDASEEMLEKALEKRDASGLDILYLCQDMRSFELYGTVRAVICACDSVNYITDPDELAEVFKTVRLYLEPDGVFVFDFNTPEKYESIGDAVISEVRDNAAFIWENRYDDESRLNEYDITFFLENEDGLYERQEEVHCQRAWTEEEMEKLLESGGFRVSERFPGYTKDDEGRTVFVCVPEDPGRHIY